MATYTTNGGIKKIATGDESGTWGTSTNTNFDILDRITNGVGAITLSGTTHTLTTTDGTLSDGMFKVLVLGGSPSGTNTITVAPNDAQKLYFIKNGSGQDAVISQGSGANVTVGNGDSAIVYCDGGVLAQRLRTFPRTSVRWLHRTTCQTWRVLQLRSRTLV